MKSDVHTTFKWLRVNAVKTLTIRNLKKHINEEVSFSEKQNKNKNLGACSVASENKKIGSIKIVLVSTGE